MTYPRHTWTFHILPLCKLHDLKTNVAACSKEGKDLEYEGSLILLSEASIFWIP